MFIKLNKFKNIFTGGKMQKYIKYTYIPTDYYKLTFILTNNL